MDVQKKDLKALFFIILFVGIQSCAYYIGKAFNINPTLINTKFDYNTPYISYFAYFYIFWYLFIILVPFIIYKKDKQNLYKYFTMIFIGSIMASITFIVFPTKIERVIPGNSISDKIIKILYILDDPTCCMPSLHCLICFYIIFAIINTKYIKKYVKIIIIIISICIILSTLFIKQHVILDVVAALIISLASYFIVYKKDISYFTKIKL